MFPCRKFQVVAPIDKTATSKTLCPRYHCRYKHICDHHRPSWNPANAQWAGLSWRVLSAFYKQLFQLLVWPTERETYLWEEMHHILDTIYSAIFLNIYTSDIFRIDLGCRLNPIDSLFVICGGIIAARFENHSRHISTAGVYKFRQSVSYNLAPNTCDFS